MLELFFMRGNLLYLVPYILVGGIAVGLITFLGYNLFGRNRDVVSPIPNFLTLLSNKQVSTISLWLPFSRNTQDIESKKMPEISAKSALVYDLTKDKVLFEKNPKEKLPMASLTKIMTAVVAIENKKDGRAYIVEEKDLVGENSMGLSFGEALSLEELLYGLILHSGNDAAETLASNFPGGRSVFIDAMNNKVKSLGLSDTYFTNPSGLEGDGNQHSTAYDLLVTTKFAMEFPLFRKIVGTFSYSIPETPTHKEYVLENQTNLLSSYPGVLGVKDGYTPEAGLCLITYLEYGGRKIVGIILGSDNRREEMKELLDFSLESEGIIPPPRH